MENLQGAAQQPAGGYGPTLAAAVAAHGPLPTRSVLTLAAVLAEALSAAHAAGVIHPGLSPAGVLLTPGGPRLTDPGIPQAAHRAQPAPVLTPPGTPDFRPPEVAAGLDAGPASDMYRLGVLLLYAATGAWMTYFAWHLDQLPAELRPIIEHCMAADPARRPTAAGLRAELTSAHPEAVGPAAWPTGIPAPAAAPAPGIAPSGGWPAPGTAPSGGWPAPTPAPSGGWPAPGGTPAPPFPAQAITPVARKRRDTRKMRRRAWVIATAMLAVAVAIGGTVYLLHPWPYPVLQPTGLTAGQRTATSISFSWSNPASGPLPDKYVILRDNAVAATVSGGVIHFTEEGLSPGTTYDFRVIAYRGSASSQPSPDLRVITQKPALSAAVFNSSFPMTEQVKSGGSSVTGDANGDSWYDIWTFSSSCAVGPCAAHLSGAIDGEDFTVTLKPASDGSYAGTTPINNYYYCGSQTNYTHSTLQVRVKPVAAAVEGTQWQVAHLSGTVNWQVDANANGGCAAAALVISATG